jgi:glycine/serine hydroxymethyltransferase
MQRQTNFRPYSRRTRKIHGLELIASENFASDEVMEAAGSVLINMRKDILENTTEVVK